MKLSRASTYAFYGLAYIAAQEAERFVPLSEIHAHRGVPEKHLAKIFQSLVRAGVLKSARGVRGGFRLARPAGEVSALDVIQAVEGPIAMGGCLLLVEDCDRDSACRINDVWRRAQGRMVDELRAATLVDMMGTGAEDFAPPVPASIGRKPAAQ